MKLLEAVRSTNSARAVAVMALLMALGVSTMTARAQELTGEIDGRIADPSGAVVPNISVVIKNEDQNIVARTVQTNGQGQFTVPLLPLGRYSVSVKATGFRPAISVIEVHTGSDSTVNLVLVPGAVTEAVTVSADSLIAPQTDSSAAGTLIPSRKMTELSLSSRNFVQLVAIQPGVSGGIPGGTQDRGAIAATGGVNSATYEVNGIPAQYNGYFLDGQDLQRRSAGGTQIGAYPGIDFIQEINLLRSTFGAQYGGSGSAYVSIASKSGNSSFHGSIYSFYRSQLFNANSYFNNLAGVPKPLTRYNDFGYEIDGPLWLPHLTSRKSATTFFSFGQEFLRSESSVQATLSNVPTAAQRLGNFTQPVCALYTSAGACATSSTQITAIDPVAQAYLTDVINKVPLPNSPTDTQGLISPEPGTNNETQTFARIDHHFNDKFSVMFRFFNDPFSLIVPYGLRQGTQAPGVGTGAVTDGDRAYYAIGTYVISPTNVLQAGGGYLRSYVTATAIGSLLAANSPDVHVKLPYANTTGRISDLAIGGSTYATISPYTNGEPQTQIFANDTQTIGRHTLSAGFNLEWQKAGNNTATTNAGSFNFKATTVPKGSTATQFQQAFANFLVGNVGTFTQVSPDPSVYLHANVYEGYVQDDFHASRVLTLNLGLRYEYIVSPSSGTLKGHPYLPFVNFLPSHYKTSTAGPIDTSGLVCVTAPCNGGVQPNPSYDPLDGIVIANLTSPYGSKVYTQPKTEFAPRFGFAYDVGGRGKTAIRGGFGIYYLQSTTAPYGGLGSNNQPNINNLQVNNTNFSNPGSAIVAGNPTPQVVTAAQEIWKSPYMEVYSLDLQHTFWSSVLFDVGYFGNHGVHLPVSEDINQPLPGAYATKGIIPNNVVTSANTPNLNQIRPYLGYGPISSTVQGFSSNYNGLQTSLTKRFQSGSLVTVNYTYSRALTNAFSPRNIYDPGAEYGPDATGRTNLLNLNFVYEVPFFAHERSVRGYTLGGWEFSGIVGFGSGQFLTVTTSAVDPAGQGLLATGASQTSGRPDYVSNPNTNAPHTLKQWFNTAAFSAVPAGQYRQGNSRNGSVIGPGYEDLDLSLFKNFSFTESWKGQFRFETFNVLNHTNFAALSTTTSATNYGQVTSTGASRVLQLAAKITF
ncbi:MAG: carboxypeptidase regulatory-like domain-containing protein [Acidobacteriota bacterium]